MTRRDESYEHSQQDRNNPKDHDERSRGAHSIFCIPAGRFHIGPARLGNLFGQGHDLRGDGEEILLDGLSHLTDHSGDC